MAVPLPLNVLAHILECLGEAGEVVRAASSCKALWLAAAGPLKQVHSLVLHCASDLEAQQLLALQHRFPHVQQLHVADGCWAWTGCSSLAAWAATLTALQADSTAFPLAATVLPPHQQQQLAQRQAAAPPSTPPATDDTPPRQQLQPADACSVPALSAGSARHRPRQQLHGAASVPAQLQGLLQLRLRHTVTSVIKCRRHGSSECDCMDFTVLAVLLQQNPGLQLLDLAGNCSLPDRLLEAAVLAASCSRLCDLDLSGCELLRPRRYVAAAFPALQRLDVSNTAVTDGDLQALAEGLAALMSLALCGCRRVSNTGLDAIAAAPALVNGCLTSLDLGGLTRPGPVAMTCLAAAWTAAARADSSSHAAEDGAYAGVQLHVGLARTACVTDAVLQAFVTAAPAATAAGAVASQGQQRQASGEADITRLLQQLEGLDIDKVPGGHSSTMRHSSRQDGRGLGGRQGGQQQQQQQLQQQPAISLCALHLAGCNGVSSSMLLQLGACGALASLTSLDLCDAEALRHPLHHQQQQQQQQQGLAPSAALPAGPAGVPCPSSSSSLSSGACSQQQSRSVLPQLLAHTGQRLRVLLLDGCFIDDAAAAAVAAQGLPLLQELSLVGCRGLGSTGLRRLLCSVPRLQQLSIGGSVSAWSEGPALRGLPVLGALTQLKLTRRPVLRDAELAPVLAEAASLRSLSLVGCYMLTDRLFELATAEGARQGTAAAAAWAGSQEPWAQPCGLGPSVETAAGPDGGGNVMGGACVTAPLRQQLTQLCVAACDGFVGSSIARLKGLQHLRMSFCASLSPAALQGVVVSCTRLQLLELPAGLSRQGLGFTTVRFDGAGQSPQHQQPDGGRHRGRHGGGRAGQSQAACGGGGGVELVLPQLGAAQRPRQLKVNWL